MFLSFRRKYIRWWRTITKAADFATMSSGLETMYSIECFRKKNCHHYYFTMMLLSKHKTSGTHYFTVATFSCCWKQFFQLSLACCQPDYLTPCSRFHYIMLSCGSFDRYFFSLSRRLPRCTESTRGW